MPLYPPYPAGTTSRAGVLQLDGTASDIQPTGPQAAGATGKAADAGHVHFSSGMLLCAPYVWAPSVQTAATISTTTMAPFTGPASTVAAGSNGGQISLVASWSSPSAGVLAVASSAGFPPGGGTVNVAASGATTAVVTYTGTAAGQLTGCAYVSGSPSGTVSTGGAVTLTSAVASTGSFTAPASGNVLVTATFVGNPSAASIYQAFGLAAHGTVTPIVGNEIEAESHTNAPLASTWRFYVSGLTPGASYNFDLLGATASGSYTITAIAATGTSPTLGSGAAGSPLIMTVQAM